MRMRSPYRPHFGGNVAAMGGIDADALLWRDAVVTNGGTVSADRLAIISTFIVAEKVAGTWALTDDYWGFWAENAVQALTSLKQRRLATAVNTPTFTTDRDYAFNGSTQYVDTGFVPSTHAVAMGVNSVHAEVYERTNTTAANADAMGAFGTSSRLIVIIPRNATTMSVTGNANAGNYTLGSADSRGLSQGGRFAATLTDIYGAKNGVDLVNSALPTVLGASLPPLSIFAGGSNNGALVRPRACSVGYLAVGAALSAAQRLARYNNVQAWASALPGGGAQV